MALLQAIATCVVVFSLSTRGVAAQNSSSSTLSLAVFISAINSTGSFTGGSDVGRPFVEAVDLAVELINDDTNMIPGYFLEAHYSDSQVNKLFPFC